MRYMSDDVHTEGWYEDGKKELSKITGTVSKKTFDGMRDKLKAENDTLKATNETMQEAINKMFKAVIQNVNSESMTYDDMISKMRFHVNDLTSSVNMLREQVLEQAERQKQLIEDHKKQLREHEDKLNKQFLEYTMDAAEGWVKAREDMEKKIKELEDNHAQIVPQQPDNHASPANTTPGPQHGTNPFLVPV